ncbi:AAA ATPase [Borealophlyctis nickersoniae]|nr:AAA ATPase [Borealophlyctis nickersoniae]
MLGTRKRARALADAEQTAPVVELPTKRTRRCLTPVKEISEEDSEPRTPTTTRRRVASTPKKTPRTTPASVRQKNVLTESFRQTKVASTASTPKKLSAAKASATTPTTTIHNPLFSTPTSNRIARTPGTPRTPTMVYQEAKSLFRRCNTPSRLVGRSMERQVITKFWEDHVLEGVAGALYISGCPGTGKTALLEEILRDVAERTVKATHEVNVVKINCMTVSEPKMLYPKLLQELQYQAETAKESVKILEGIFIPERTGCINPMFVLILDELDQLITKDQDILYKLFEWTTLPYSRLVVIGIANALDLTDRFLPRLKAKNCEPRLLNFDPYNVEEIKEIIKQRLSSLDDDDEGDASREQQEKEGENCRTAGAKQKRVPLMEPMAIEMAARKIAGTGDVRKVLDVCRQAFEKMEAKSRIDATLDGAALPVPRGYQSKSKAAVVPDSPAKTVQSLDELPKVTLHQILSATSSVLGGSKNVERIKGLSLHPKMVLCTLVVMGKAKKADINSFTLYQSYAKLCQLQKHHIIAVEETEFTDVVTSLEASGFVAFTNAAGRGKKAMGGAEMKSRPVGLSIRPEDVERACRDHALLNAVLDTDVWRL